jgi:hypothetical protein
MALQPVVGPWPLFQFVDLFIIHSIGLFDGDQSVARLLPAHGTAQTQNKRTQTSIPSIGFEPTIPVIERVKTVHALDSAATAMGLTYHLN